MTVFFTDSDTDVSLAQAKALNFELISMPYSIDDKVVYPYEDFEEFDAPTFYNLLRDGTLPTTSAVSEEKYIQYFEPHFANGDDIFYVHFSRAMTATFNNMDKALETLKAKYPDRKFWEIDTKGITTISFAIVNEVAALRDAGKTPEEILAWAETEVDKFAMYFFADDLKFFKRSGRVGGLAATMGTLIGVRPIISMTAAGKMESVGKERGRTKAMERLVQYVEELGDDVKGHTVYVGHTDTPEIAEELKAMLLEKFGSDLNVVINIVNPTAGSHCGPNGAGICFHSIHR